MFYAVANGGVLQGLMFFVAGRGESASLDLRSSYRLTDRGADGPVHIPVSEC